MMASLPFLLAALMGLAVVATRRRVTTRQRPLMRIVGGAGLLALVLVGGGGASPYVTVLATFGVLLVAWGLVEAYVARRRIA